MDFAVADTQEQKDVDITDSDSDDETDSDDDSSIEEGDEVAYRSDYGNGDDARYVL